MLFLFVCMLFVFLYSMLNSGVYQKFALYKYFTIIIIIIITIIIIAFLI